MKFCVFMGFLIEKLCKSLHPPLMSILLYINMLAFVLKKIIVFSSKNIRK